MIIQSLRIQDLYGHYNYDVHFNRDLTFIYGENGCGKTTILNILEAVVSGHVYRLFSWQFEKILLGYHNDDEDDRLKIIITYSDSNIRINYNGDNKTIRREEYIRALEEADTDDELFSLMEHKYPILNDIQGEFNYIYLPLNRSRSSGYETLMLNEMERIRRFRFFYDNERRFGSRDAEIAKAARLVQKRYIEATTQVNLANDEFRNSVLKNLLSTSLNISDEEFLNALSSLVSADRLDPIKTQYLQLLDSLNLLSDAERAESDKFFSEYRKVVKQLQQVEDRAGDHPIPLSLIYGCYEVMKMETVIPLAQEMEKKKAMAMRRIDVFVDTMNSFIHRRHGDKKLLLDEAGRICFTAHGDNTDIEVSNLSSGEKQLLIFFANLVFKVDDSTPSIFVVDEPELSLHLSWQRTFVERAMQVNKNMQLILATHAPEIIGRYRKKMFRLEKQYHE